jgi:lambda family phage minor tail protein L
MSQQKVNLEATKFNPSTLLSLYELDATSVGGPQLFFHDGLANNFQNLVFNGISYTAFPIEMTGFEYDGKGSLPRPKLRASNIRGFVSAYILSSGDLVGAKFIRRRVFARFIDAVNFPNGVNPYGSADPTAAYADDIFYVNRKVTENNDYVEFELATALEIDNVKLPRRQIFAHICGFKYRDSSCGYSGAPVADKNNNKFSDYYGFTLVDKGEYSAATTYNQGDYVYLVSNLQQTLGQRIFFVCSANGIVGADKGPMKNSSSWIPDFCSKMIVGCRCRYPSPVTLPFGGFPGVSRGAFV